MGFPPPCKLDMGRGRSCIGTKYVLAWHGKVCGAAMCSVLSARRGSCTIPFFFFLFPLWMGKKKDELASGGNAGDGKQVYARGLGLLGKGLVRKKQLKII
jgi:hypothetical protein